MIQSSVETPTTERKRARPSELEQLATTVSHDLSQPLTTIAGFADLLGRRYEGQLDPEADEFLAYILKGTDRMRAMIEDLVSYLRTPQDEPPHSAVDCSRAVQAALDSLAPSIAETGATVTAEPLPVVQGDAPQIGQLFGHLISNALKFANGEPPRVHISAEREADGFCFSVVDNGIGMDAEQAWRAFELFQRLHNPESNSGTGVGLPICKKIVERHGGRIWVEPGPNGGSNFRFTISNSGSAPA